jgi:alpha-L-arabinofuranosidase
MRLKTEDGETRKIEVTEMKKVNEEWTIQDGVAAQTSDKTMTGILSPESVGGSYTFELKARKTGGLEGFLIYFGRSEDNQNGYLFNIGGWNNTQTALESTRGSSNQVLSEKVDQTIETGRWYDIRVVVSKAGTELWIDGVMTLRYMPVSSLQQFIVSGYDEAAGEVVLKVVNADSVSWNASVKLVNAAEIDNTGQVILLESKSLYDENSFDEPLKISPQTSTFEGFSKEFTYLFKPSSFTILRIKASR